MWSVDPAGPIHRRYTVGVVEESASTVEEGFIRVVQGSRLVVLAPRVEDAHIMLAQDIEAWMVNTARRRVAVHAAVVSHEARAIVMPGASGNGKTTLSMALIERGATYLSDELAILDSRGRVHPYARRLRPRRPDGARAPTIDPVAGGWPVATAPVEIGVIVFMTFRKGAPFEPIELSPGQAMVALLGNTFGVSRRPEMTLQYLETACSSAWLVRAERDEAQEAAVWLLQRVEV